MGEYWRGIKVKLADDEKSLRQLNAQLQEAGVDWESWLSQPSPALATDLRSEALLQLLEKPLPALPLARAAREAIGAARLSRLRCDGALEAAKAELKLSTDELASMVHVQATSADAQPEQSREVGQLRGQVEALQVQAKEAIDRERSLREQVLLADEVARKEQCAQAEATRQRAEVEQELKLSTDELADMMRAQATAADVQLEQSREL